MATKHSGKKGGAKKKRRRTKASPRTRRQALSRMAKPTPAQDRGNGERREIGPELYRLEGGEEAPPVEAPATDAPPVEPSGEPTPAEGPPDDEPATTEAPPPDDEPAGVPTPPPDEAQASAAS